MYSDPNPDPGYFLKIYWIFLAKQNFQIFCLIFFFAYFYAKTIQKSGNYNLSFWIVQIWGLKIIFFFAVFGLYFAPWIRIPGSAFFADPGSQILRFQPIRILSSAFKPLILRTVKGLSLQVTWDYAYIPFNKDYIIHILLIFAGSYRSSLFSAELWSFLW